MPAAAYHSADFPCEVGSYSRVAYKYDQAKGYWRRHVAVDNTNQEFGVKDNVNVKEGEFVVLYGVSKNSTDQVVFTNADDMPAKENAPSIGGQRQRYHFQFITTPTADTPETSLLLHFDDQRYVFGRIGEGTQRACIQRGISLKKAHNFFLTGTTTWKHNGGLIGLILTLADVQREMEDDKPQRPPPLNIFGGPKLLHSVSCARRFVFRTGMPLKVHELSVSQDNGVSSQPSYEDGNIRVWGLPLSVLPTETIPSDEDSREQSTANAKLDFRSYITNDQWQNQHRDVQAEQTLRQDVVHNMFDSDWQKDRLFETPFKDVKMPATVWIRDPQTKVLSGTACLTRESAPHIGPDQMVLVRKAWPASLVARVPPADNLPSDVSMCYIIKGQAQRGSFLPKKAIELGIRPGPLFRRLTLGESVEGKDGIIVTPEMVLGPSKPGRGIVVFDIVDLRHLYAIESLLDKSLTKHLDAVDVAVWILGPLVSPRHEVFRRVIGRLQNLEHVVSGNGLDSNSIAMACVAKTTTRLSRILAQQCRIPVHNNNRPYAQRFHSEDVSHTSNGASEHQAFRIAERGLKIETDPKLMFPADEIPAPLDVGDFDAIVTAPEAEALMPSTRPESTVSFDTRNEPEITTLGTGSAVPSKYRNVSATLLRMPNGQGSFLLDCGENTLGQLRRMFEAPQLHDVLCDLRGIWISHLHADHHLGTISLLTACANAVQRDAESKRGSADRHKKKLCVFSERNMMDFLVDYSSVEPLENDYLQVLPVVCHPTRGATLNGQTFSFQKYGLSIRDIETARVRHCYGAQAISITFEDGFKISYSGDCRPSAGFTRIGKDSDVLIHEATFDDGMEGDAKAKRHCTTGEALSVAAQMGAKNVILTHFSQRYQKIPVLSNVKSPDEIHFEEGNLQDESAVAGPVDDGISGDSNATQTEETPYVWNHPLADNGIQDTPRSDPGVPPLKDTSETFPITSNFDTAFSDPTTGILQPTSDPTSTPNQIPMNVCVAFDYMRVRVSEIKHLRAYYPAIQKMFEIELAKSNTTEQPVPSTDNIEGKSDGKIFQNINRAKKTTTAAAANGHTPTDNSGKNGGSFGKKGREPTSGSGDMTKTKTEVYDKGEGEEESEVTQTQMTRSHQSPKRREQEQEQEHSNANFFGRDQKKINTRHKESGSNRAKKKRRLD